MDASPITAARVRSGLLGPAVALHLLAFAYLLLFTRDRADWTIGVFKTYGDLMRAIGTLCWSTRRWRRRCCGCPVW